MERAWPRNEMMPGHTEEFIKMNEVNLLDLFHQCLIKRHGLLKGDSLTKRSPNR